MGPLHFTPARGSRAGCGHLGWSPKVTMGCMSRQGRWMSIMVLQGNRMLRTRWGGMQRVPMF